MKSLSYCVQLFCLYKLRQRGQCGDEASLCASLTRRLKSQIGVVSAAESTISSAEWCGGTDATFRTQMWHI